ncbi:MAG: DUF2470 domain-containing protein [Actinomycetota bacterium]
MTEDFSEQEKAIMIEHMNDDHSDACLIYATHYLGLDAAQSASMTGITRSTMTLDIDLADGASETVTYSFERPLTSVEDAAMFLAQMVYTVTGEPESSGS